MISEGSGKEPRRPLTYGKAGRCRNTLTTLLPEEKISEEDIQTNDSQDSKEVKRRLTTSGRTGVPRGRISRAQNLQNSSKDPIDNPVSANCSQLPVVLFPRPRLSGLHGAGTKRDYSGKEIYTSSISDDERESLQCSAKLTTVGKRRNSSRPSQNVEGATWYTDRHTYDVTSQACAILPLLGGPLDLQDSAPGLEDGSLGDSQRFSDNRSGEVLQGKVRNLPRTEVHSTEAASWKSGSTFRQYDLLQHQNKLSVPTLEYTTTFPVAVPRGTESESVTKNNSMRRVGTQQENTLSRTDLRSSLDPLVGTAGYRNQPYTRLRDRLQGDSSKSNGSTDYVEDGRVNSCRVSTETFTEPSMISGFDLLWEIPFEQKSSQTVVQLKTKSSSAAPKTTYARQRSFRIEALADGEATLDLSISDQYPVGPLSGQDETGAGFRSVKSLPDPKVCAEEFENTQNGAIRSIYELREAGSNARVTVESEALLESIDRSSTSPISLQCSAILQLAKRLRHRTFCSHFVNHGLENRLLKYAKLCLNPIVSGLLLIAFLHMVSCPYQRDRLSEFGGKDIFDFLAIQLERTDDLVSIVQSQAHVVSRSAQLDIEEYCGKLLTSNIWGPYRPSRITARTLSLLCLYYITSNLGRAGARYEMITRALLVRLMDVLLSREGVPTLGPDLNLALDTKLALSTLEWCTMASSSAEADFGSLWTIQTLRKIAELLPRVLGWATSPAERLQTLALQVSVNLTNGNQVVCSTFSQSNIIQACISIVACNFDQVYVEPASEHHDIFLNDLVLSLGVLINLAEESEGAREIFLESTAGLYQPVYMLVRLFNAKVQRPSTV